METAAAADETMSPSSRQRAASSSSCRPSSGRRAAPVARTRVPTAELLGRAIITAARGEADDAVALAADQATRDRLSERLFATADAIASFTWDLDHIPMLLRQLSVAMSDEVTWLSELEPIGAAA